MAEHASSTCAAESEKGGLSSEARHLGGSRRAGHTDAVPAHPPHTLHRFAGQNQKPRKTRKQGARAVPAPQNKACFPEHASLICHADSETGENSSVAMSSGRSSHAGHTDPAPLPPNTLPRFAQKIWKLSETSRSQENMLPRFDEEVQKQVQTIWSVARTKARRPPSQQRKACESWWKTPHRKYEKKRKQVTSTTVTVVEATVLPLVLHFSGRLSRMARMSETS